MKSLHRDLVASTLAGLSASIVLWPALGGFSALVFGTLAGLGWAFVFRGSVTGLAGSAASGAVLGLPLWLLSVVVFLPGVGEASRHLSPEVHGALLPMLWRFLLFGGVLGGLGHGVSRAIDRALGSPLVAAQNPEDAPRRVVIIGGGHAGIACARELERLLGPDRSVRVALVADSRSLLETRLRTNLRRTAVVRGVVSRIDLEAREVHVASYRGEPPRVLAYDHLVLTPGTATSHLGNRAILVQTSGLRSIRETIRVRSRVIDAFERAERELEPARRRALLTFVVAGGGVPGAELAGALNDFARGVLADFPRLAAEHLRVVLIHPAARILSELPKSLATYAQNRLRERGVEFRLGARVQDTSAGVVVLHPPETLESETLFFTTGARLHPLLETLPLARGERGAPLWLDSTPGGAGLPATGESAAATSECKGERSLPGAQLLVREGRRLGRNVLATLRRRTPRPFQFNSLRALCLVGHQVACGELTLPFTREPRVSVSGFLAWMLWRVLYVARLPGLDRKLCVATASVIELLFPRGIPLKGEGGTVATAARDRMRSMPRA